MNRHTKSPVLWGYHPSLHSLAQAATEDGYNIGLKYCEAKTNVLVICAVTSQLTRVFCVEVQMMLNLHSQISIFTFAFYNVHVLCILDLHFSDISRCTKFKKIKKKDCLHCEKSTIRVNIFKCSSALLKGCSNTLIRHLEVTFWFLFAFEH